MGSICGIYNFDEKKIVDKKILKKMSDKLKHRGADKEGYYLNGNIGFGYKQFMIGYESREQSISNENETIWIVLDGEIYNYVELREFLIKKGHKFSTKSDEEVIIHLYEDYEGDCLEFLRGMFVIAIWDERKKRLFIATDKIGQKTLYYINKDGKFVFASEIKSLLEFPEYEKEINFEGINYLFAYEWWIPWPYTSFKNIYKMLPATYFMIEGNKLTEKKYWTPDFINKTKKKEKEIVDELYNLIDESVKIRLRNNIPVGALLSGGVDSSGIVAFMSNYLSHIKTFTIGFQNKEKLNQEFLRAREISEMFRTEHYEVLLTDEDLIENIPQLVINHDEPYVCITGLYTYFLTKFIKEKGISLTLSGNGPDEIFWGYSSGVDLKIKSIVNGIAKYVPDEILNIFPKFLFPKNIQIRIENLKKPFSIKLSEGINKKFEENTFGLFKENFPKINKNYGELAKEYFSEAEGKTDLITAYSYTALMLTYAFGLTIQPNLDGMANTVEIKSPFLDQKIIEFAFSLPLEFKVKGFTPKGCKYIFKKTMEKKLPKNLLYTKKLAFGTDIKWEKLIIEKFGEKIKEEVLNGWWVKNNFFSREYIEMLFSKMPETKTSLQILRLYTLELWYRIYFKK